MTPKKLRRLKSVVETYVPQPERSQLIEVLNRVISDLVISQMMNGVQPPDEASDHPPSGPPPSAWW